MAIEDFFFAINHFRVQLAGVWIKNSINEKDFLKNFNFIDYSFNNLNEFLDTIKMRG